jgi:hypothetical protein
MTRVRCFAIAALLLLTTAMPARADLTGFLGVNLTPANRQTVGAAFGAGLLIIGFEGEYAATAQDVPSGSPSLQTGMGSLLLQTPGAFFGFQPYFATGGGIYHEVLGAHSDTGIGLNTGGGVKISLIGPIRLRVDYRLLKLGNGALYPTAHRIYAGLNLKL